MILVPTNGNQAARSDVSLIFVPLLQLLSVIEKLPVWGSVDLMVIVSPQFAVSMAVCKLGVVHPDAQTLTVAASTREAQSSVARMSLIFIDQRTPEGRR